jgi:hypothetical protein
MGFMSDIQTVAANTMTANILAGKQHEFATRPSLARVAVVGAAAGVNATIVVGDQAVVNDQEISSANRYPLDPDDYAFRIPIAPTERLQIFLRITTAGGIAVTTVVQLDPVA